MVGAIERGHGMRHRKVGSSASDVIEKVGLKVDDLRRFGWVRNLEEKLISIGGNHPEIAIAFPTQLVRLQTLAEMVLRQCLGLPLCNQRWLSSKSGVEEHVVACDRQSEKAAGQSLRC